MYLIYIYENILLRCVGEINAVYLSADMKGGKRSIVKETMSLSRGRRASFPALMRGYNMVSHIFNPVADRWERATFQ